MLPPFICSFGDAIAVPHMTAQSASASILIFLFIVLFLSFCARAFLRLHAVRKLRPDFLTKIYCRVSAPFSSCSSFLVQCWREHEYCFIGAVHRNGVAQEPRGGGEAEGPNCEAPRFVVPYRRRGRPFRHLGSPCLSPLALARTIIPICFEILFHRKRTKRHPLEAVQTPSFNSRPREAGDIP